MFGYILVHCDAFYLLFIYISGLLCYISLFVQMMVVVRPNAGQICACKTLVEGHWAEIFILDQGALQRYSYSTRVQGALQRYLHSTRVICKGNCQ